MFYRFKPVTTPDYALAWCPATVLPCHNNGLGVFSRISPKTGRKTAAILLSPIRQPATAVLFIYIIIRLKRLNDLIEEISLVLQGFPTSRVPSRVGNRRVASDLLASFFFGLVAPAPPPTRLLKKRKVARRRARVAPENVRARVSFRNRASGMGSAAGATPGLVVREPTSDFPCAHSVWCTAAHAANRDANRGGPL